MDNNHTNNKKQYDNEQLLSLLGKISLFSEISDNRAYMEQLLTLCDIRSYQPNNYIFNEGERSDELFILLSGSVDILRKTRAGDYYTVITLQADKYIFFGEQALIDDNPRSATVRTRDAADCLVITAKQFNKLKQESPAIALPVVTAIASIISGHLRKTTSDMLLLFDALVDEIKGDDDVTENSLLIN